MNGFQRMTKETNLKDAADACGRTCEPHEGVAEQGLGGGTEGGVGDETLRQKVEEGGGPAVRRAEGRGAAGGGEEDGAELVEVVVRGLSVGHLDDDAAKRVDVDEGAVGAAAEHLGGHPGAGA